MTASFDYDDVESYFTQRKGKIGGIMLSSILLTEEI